MQSCFLIAEHRKCFLEKETTPRKNAITIVEMVTQGLEHYISLVDKAVTGFKRIDSSFERGFVVAKCWQTELNATEKSFMNGWVNQANFIVVLF